MNKVGAGAGGGELGLQGAADCGKLQSMHLVSGTPQLSSAQCSQMGARTQVAELDCSRERWKQIFMSNIPILHEGN